MKDGNDLEEIDNAINKAKSQQGPTIIEVKTVIGLVLQIKLVQMEYMAPAR